MVYSPEERTSSVTECRGCPGWSRLFVSGVGKKSGTMGVSGLTPSLSL